MGGGGRGRGRSSTLWPVGCIYLFLDTDYWCVDVVGCTVFYE